MRARWPPVPEGQGWWATACRPRWRPSGTAHFTALADRGYYAGPEILECEQARIIPLVPKSHTSNNLANGQFGKRDFHYIPEKDEYRCPAGQRSIWRCNAIERGQTLGRYCSSACPVA